MPRLPSSISCNKYLGNYGMLMMPKGRHPYYCCQQDSRSRHPDEATGSCQSNESSSLDNNCGYSAQSTNDSTGADLSSDAESSFLNVATTESHYPPSSAAGYVRHRASTATTTVFAGSRDGLLPPPGGLNVETVRNIHMLVECCLRSFMDQETTIQVIRDRGFHPRAVRIVWMQLEKQNPDFFARYYNYLETTDSSMPSTRTSWPQSFGNDFMISVSPVPSTCSSVA